MTGAYMYIYCVALCTSVNSCASLGSKFDKVKHLPKDNRRRREARSSRLDINIPLPP